MTLLHITNIKDQAILPLPLSPRSVSEWKGQRRALESNGLKWTFMATLARKVAAYSWTPDIGKCVKDHAWFGKKNGYTLFCSFWLAFQHDLCAWCYWNTLLCAKPWTLSKQIVWRMSSSQKYDKLTENAEILKKIGVTRFPQPLL